MRIHIVWQGGREGGRGREEHACVGSRAAARSNERILSLPLSRARAFAPFLSCSFPRFLPIYPSHSRFSIVFVVAALLLSLLGRARALSQTRYQFLTFARECPLSRLSSSFSPSRRRVDTGSLSSFSSFASSLPLPSRATWSYDRSSQARFHYYRR